MTANINQERDIRVLCVDDDELVGQIIRITLKHAGGFEWLGQLHSADELLDRSCQEAPDVVLLDLCMPGKSAFVAMQELIALCPKTRILLFTGYAGQNLIDRAIEAGASGYLCKHEDALEIIDAIRRVAHGEFVMGPSRRAVAAGTYSCLM